MKVDEITLLIADDCADLAGALHRFFQVHDVVRSLGWVEDGDAIVPRVRELRPDVLLLDLTMPGRDPLAAVEELRSGGLPIRTIAFSGYDDAETRRRAEDAGVDAFLSKDGDLDAIAETVIRVVRAGA